MSAFTESIVEDAALAWLEGLDYAVLHGPEIAVGDGGGERMDRKQLKYDQFRCWGFPGVACERFRSAGIEPFNQPNVSSVGSCCTTAR